MEHFAEGLFMNRIVHDTWLGVPLTFQLNLDIELVFAFWPFKKSCSYYVYLPIINRELRTFNYCRKIDFFFFEKKIRALVNCLVVERY